MEDREIKKILNLAKFLALVILFLIIMAIIECCHAEAAVITGEKALGGFSLLRQKVIEKDGYLIDHDDLELMAEVVYWENYANGTEAMILTGSVVLNRVETDGWPNTIRDVLYEKGQYSTTKYFFTETIPQAARDVALHLLLCGSQCPRSVQFQAMRPQGSGIYKQIKTDFFCYR